MRISTAPALTAPLLAARSAPCAMLAPGPSAFPYVPDPLVLFNAIPVNIKYWDLHGFLLIPTAWLLTAGAPVLLAGGKEASAMKRDASFSYLAFIISIAVMQAFVWDTVGAEIGIWQFNPEKCTDMGATTSLLPLEEVLWLFHHVLKAALWQLKVSEFTEIIGIQTGSEQPLPGWARTGGTLALCGITAAGATALFSDYDNAKCLGLVAAFFAPVAIIILNLGTRYWRSHWKLFLLGWLPPGLWTVLIDAVGQWQGVWYFPPRFLSGINDPFDGWFKLDIAAVYLVSTFAVTATGAIILAAADELNSRRPTLTADAGDAVDEVVAIGQLQEQLQQQQQQQQGQQQEEEEEAKALGAQEALNLGDLAAFIFESTFPGLVPRRVR